LPACWTRELALARHSGLKQALDLRLELDLANLAAESQAGLAGAFMTQGDLPAALEQVEAVLRHLETGSLDGTEESLRIYLICFQVLQSVGDGRARQALEQAYAELQERAAKMDATSRRMFLESVPHHWQIIEAWQAVQAS